MAVFDWIYDTATMLECISIINPVPTFLRDRYFPTDGEEDIFYTEDVLVEYEKDNEQMAPCVVPGSAGILMARSGRNISRYSPANVEFKRTTTVNDLKKRGMGEALLGSKSETERAAALLRKDIREADRSITRREEYMAAQTMLYNACTLRHYIDEYGGNKYEDWTLKFYRGEGNPGTYVPAKLWTDADADILGDIEAMAEPLLENGQGATDLIMAGDVHKTILNNPKVKEYLDISNYSLGDISPVQLEGYRGVTKLGELNVNGLMVSLITVKETYIDEITRKRTPMIPSGTVILTAPAAGRTRYGAVNQIEEYDRELHIWPGRRVPKHTTNVDANIKTLLVTSRPLMMPRTETPWIVAKVM